MSNMRPPSASSDNPKIDLADLIEEKELEIMICEDKLILLKALRNKNLWPYELALFLKEEPSLLLGMPINNISAKELIEQIHHAASLDATVLNIEKQHEQTNDHITRVTKDYLKQTSRLLQKQNLPEEHKEFKEQADKLKATIYNKINFNHVDKLLAAIQQEIEQHKSDLVKLRGDPVKAESQPAAPKPR